MLGKGHILAILVISISSITVIATAQEELIPPWIKNIAQFWVEGDVSDQEFVSALEYLIQEEIVKFSKPKIVLQDSNSPARGIDLPIKGSKDAIDFPDYNQYNMRIDDVLKENEKNKDLVIQYQNKISQLEAELEAIESSYIGEAHQQPPYDPAQTSGRVQSQDCEGYADCFSGKVTEIVDGDTIKVDGKSIRFTLVDTPEYGDYGYTLAKNFISSICPVGSIALVDEDDYQTEGSYGRTIAVVYCNGMNLNKAVLDQGYAEIDTYFCSQSEFEYHSWAQLYGCEYEEPEYLEEGCYGDHPYQWSDGLCYNLPEYLDNGCPRDYPYVWSDGDCYNNSEPVYDEPEPVDEQPSCDPSYPDVCIPVYPPDLNCGDIPYKNFRVVGSDPHGFDGDGDGIGCES